MTLVLPVSVLAANTPSTLRSKPAPGPGGTYSIHLIKSVSPVFSEGVLAIGYDKNIPVLLNTFPPVNAFLGLFFFLFIEWRID